MAGSWAEIAFWGRQSRGWFLGLAGCLMCEGNVAGIPALKLMFLEGKKLLEFSKYFYIHFIIYIIVYTGV